MAVTLPERGDLVWLNFTPQSGHEQAGHRPAIVISPKLYHEKAKLTVVCPITSNTSPWPWKVFLPENKVISGAILIDQIRAIDRVARNLTIVDKAPAEVMQEVQGKLHALLLQ